MVLSSAIVCDHDRRIADDRRPYCDLRSYGNQPLPAWAKDSFKTKVSLKLCYFWFTFLGPTPDINRNSTPSKITLVLVLYNRTPEISLNRINVFVY